MFLVQIKETQCTQFYFCKIDTEQIYGKQKSKDRININFQAFRFVLDVIKNIYYMFYSNNF